MKKKAPSSLKACKEALSQAEKHISELETELDQYKPKRRVAYSIDGWNVVHSGGYFRLYRKIGGKLHCVYLGKKCDEDLARKKIKAKLKELKLKK